MISVRHGNAIRALIDGAVFRAGVAFEPTWEMSYLATAPLADGAFTLQQTIDWVEQVGAANGGDAIDFMRLYAVPGMGHCRGGPSTSSFDMLTAVQEWVEQGKVPETVLATAPAGTPWEGRTRPLCTYPKVARY